MLPDPKIKCHYTGFTKTCFNMVTKCSCRKWVHLLGVNPQTGKEVDVWNCADSLQHYLMIENSKMQRETGAAVESFRNEVVKRATHREELTQLPVIELKQISTG